MDAQEEATEAQRQGEISRFLPGSLSFLASL